LLPKKRAAKGSRDHFGIAQLQSAIFVMSDGFAQVIGDGMNRYRVR
jgi:hypothetical protein